MVQHHRNWSLKLSQTCEAHYALSQQFARFRASCRLRKFRLDRVCLGGAVSYCDEK
ncbi:hypothetical protein AG1IA_02626 [Rhizoctonia solani AG-1 IA]|uniref:Uncharacterized protein n=1 Tax=Thanatephorus cucumeris (strain AG1-IA) TaxID=983506 RepID=L8WZG2_THACA|nr:hypothetical protein AG1IA_02626 [Rhizoctonia solani AG-1 IA]